MTRSSLPLALITSASLAGCALLSSEPSPSGDDAEKIAVSPAPTSRFSAKPGAGVVQKRGGGYYLDDGPGDSAPPDLDRIPDAQPINEPAHRFANKPYNVFGRDYVPLPPTADYKARGIASWYGRKFHGQKTSSGEPYDMYGMTAAHPTLPIPSYVRVTNPANGRAVVLRVNDRGPFHSDRLIDLSYTAAWKLGYINEGSTLVEVERLRAGSSATVATKPDNVPPVTVAAANPAPIPTPIPTQRDESGTYLQLGAFSNRENAESFLAHVARELAREAVPGSATEGLESKLLIRSSGIWHRVHLGPWASADAARAASAILQRVAGTPPVVINR
ncbi:MAG: septal ring lytic transglycosylase RlpA family protein [Rhodocyclaceae bacterium]|jgi:rare lipoprotein A|nr:septal ring lytic transglycosylase RlpA family protein [Rhodocyclaceae bacterium]MBK6906022.1 septal ring lytic transglycosylase RlpA family protein [Rhodocyclaceae bacterium]